MKFFISVLVLASAVLLTAQNIKEEYDSFPADYDNFYDYDQLKGEGKKIDAELDKVEAEADLKVKEEIDKFREDNKDYEDDVLEGIDDYLFEDNRDKKEEPKEIPVKNDNIAADNIDATDNDDAKKKQDDQADYALLWGDDSVAPLPVPDVELPSDYKDILEETQKLLENDADDFDDEIKKIVNPETSKIKSEDDLIDDTIQILEEINDSFNADEEIKTDDINEAEQIQDVNDHLNNENLKDEPNPVIIDDVPHEKALESDVEDIAEQDPEADVNENEHPSDVVHDVIQEEEDTVDKVYADLNSDLDKLFETLDKLSDDGVEGDEKLEDVFDKLDDRFFKEDGDNVEGSEEVVDDVKDDNIEYNDVDFNKILEDIANEADFDEDGGDSIDLNVELNDEMNEPNPDDDFENDVEKLPKINTTPIFYLDAIVDEQNNAESVEKTNDINKSVEIDASVEDKNFTQPKSVAITEDETKAINSIDIDTLNSEEVEGLVKQFSMAHSEVMDVNSETFDQNIAPIHIKLNVDSPEVVTSPNYPNPYPTNNIVDWIFDGEGIGIELNITDFLVRGAMGDYLLVKPGGVDDSGHEGILFTYRLNSEKRFRFEDVDRMFVRFESTSTGWNNMRGFQFSVKMIAPIPEEPEPIPEPEAVLVPPTHRLTLFLGTPVREFHELAADFQLIIADMAELYIQDNNIDPGLNTTAEVTQITTIAPCPVTWPNYELCSAVTFGVSLKYEEEGDMLDEEALRDMWTTYSVRDPFALRLRRMGIAEFQAPSSTVLTAWLVIASGVLISMAMLAVVLWRFSCFEDYTRMKTYSDTDSLHNEKRNLDLYPTPHQTLPALYAENEFKWQDEHEHDSTRVDMGGFANKTYARDMYDFESDEEVIAPRDRNGAVTARDIYSGSVA